MTALNLLIDPIFSCDRDGTSGRLSLPGLLEALGEDRVEGLPGLQAFQEHGWYAFLVQLAAMALEEAEHSAPQLDAATWRAALLSLTGGDAEAWHMVRGDLSAPAFLQPPLPEGSLKAWKRSVDTPDQLDLPITSKNHDLKAARALESSTEQWVYALVNLQTMQGFSGRGNYGIARMNGGFGNRPVVTLVPSMRLGRRFTRDVTLLLEHRAETASAHGFSPSGARLLWLLPWGGAESLRVGELHPWFIGLSRRVRLSERDGVLRAQMAPSKAYRVDAKDRNGVLGDPWTPIHKADNKGLTVSGRGFDYRLVHELLLTRTYDAPLAMTPSPEVSMLYCATLVRGQGVTEGFHERLIPIPRAVRSNIFAMGAPRDALAELSERRIATVATVTRSVLRPALLTLLNAGEVRSGRGDSRPDRWVRAFEAEVDDDFFQRLWADADHPEPEEAQAQWQALLYHRAQAQLEDAIRSAPIPAARRYRAIAAAEAVFMGSFVNKFDTLPREAPHAHAG